jgi:hypothetical protein
MCAAVLDVIGSLMCLLLSQQRANADET